MTKIITTDVMIKTILVHVTQTRIIQDIVLENQAKIIAILNNTEFSDEDGLIKKELQARITKYVDGVIDLNTDLPTNLF